MRKHTIKERVCLELQVISNENLSDFAQHLQTHGLEGPHALLIKSSFEDYAQLLCSQLKDSEVWDMPKGERQELRDEMEEQLRIALNSVITKHKCTDSEKKLLDELKTNFLFRMALLSGLKETHAK